MENNEEIDWRSTFYLGGGLGDTISKQTLKWKPTVLKWRPKRKYRCTRGAKHGTFDRWVSVQ